MEGGGRACAGDAAGGGGARAVHCNARRGAVPSSPAQRLEARRAGACLDVARGEETVHEERGGDARAHVCLVDVVSAQPAALHLTGRGASRQPSEMAATIAAAPQTNGSIGSDHSSGQEPPQRQIKKSEIKKPLRARRAREEATLPQRSIW